MPPYLPDNDDVRGDIADYYAEIQHFDGEVGALLELLGEVGQLENTVIFVSSDNGWQMPRGLANLYDFGTRVPLVISHPGDFPGGRAVADFVSLTDFAPTILELAGLPRPVDMTARSLVPILRSEAQGTVEPSRNFIAMGRERHAFVRKNGPGYPGRALRTADFLYIRNYEPDRWPAGDPPLYGDVDAHMLQYPSPTKMYLLKHREEPAIRPLFALAFGKRPAEELYDLREDPDQMRNVASEEAYSEARDRLSRQLTAYLEETGDPRETGGEMKWEGAEYFATKDKRPRPSRQAIEELGLDEEYSYIDE